MGSGAHGPSGARGGAPLFLLFTDFGPTGPYLGQVRVVLAREAPGLPVIDLLSDAPAFDVMSSAYLLAGYAPAAAALSGAMAVVIAVVDPGVGTDRRAVAVQADGHWYVGPDNGLFAPLVRRAARVRAWVIAWRPPLLSASFHGRDVFAPVAAALARGEAPPGPMIDPASLDRADWPDDLGRLIYIDAYGNALTGLRAAVLAPGTRLGLAGRVLDRARTFGAVPPGTAFWYENANGLAEIAVNGGRVAGVGVGNVVTVLQPPA